jgi:glycosyltransferase involved in cell wall biosynthesis
VIGSAGVIVPPDDPQALADAIVRLARDPRRRRAAASRGPERMAAYAPETVAGQVMDLVADVVGAGGADPPGGRSC